MQHAMMTIQAGPEGTTTIQLSPGPVQTSSLASGGEEGSRSEDGSQESGEASMNCDLSEDSSKSMIRDVEERKPKKLRVQIAGGSDETMFGMRCSPYDIGLAQPSLSQKHVTNCALFRVVAGLAKLTGRNHVRCVRQPAQTLQRSSCLCCSKMVGMTRKLQPWDFGVGLMAKDAVHRACTLKYMGRACGN